MFGYEAGTEVLGFWREDYAVLKREGTNIGKARGRGNVHEGQNVRGLGSKQ